MNKIVVCATVFLLWGCGEKKNTEQDEVADANADDATLPDGDSSDSNDASEETTGCPLILGTLPALKVATIALADEGATEPHLFARPMFVAQPPGQTDALWVVERGGTIQEVKNSLVTATILDISSIVVSNPPEPGDERGLLGLAFHPQYASNGRFYVYYTADDPAGDDDDDGLNVLEEYAPNSVSGQMPVAVHRLVEIADEETTHNGGMLAFSPRDGYLYVGIGDGGNQCDPHGTNGNSQNLSVLFGKILRLDVDGTAPDYAAPNNPLVNLGADSIWAYGLRNPWRFSFDRVLHHLYIADVGHSAYEEVDIQSAASSGGQNYGWRKYEGFELSICPATTTPDPQNHTQPVVVYPHGQGSQPLAGGCAITGGYVYRGAAIAGLAGIYLYGDYCTKQVAALRWCDDALRGSPQVVSDLSGLPGSTGLASFGEDLSGELYMVFSASGHVFKILPNS